MSAKRLYFSQTPTDARMFFTERECVLASDYDRDLTAARERIAVLEKERNVWKANHDNQVAIRRTLIDRPDLKERSDSMIKLTSERDALKAQLAAVLEILEAAPELNMSNYDHEQVYQLNNDMIEATLRARATKTQP